jgi:NAD(P)-dependent dehydrogenase (short-subunit alcohol dehydrogenase family)
LNSDAVSYNCLIGKNVVVTGGASGIGAAITKAFYDQGANVKIVDIQTRAAENLAKSLKTEGHKFAPQVFPCDLTKVSEIETVFANIYDSSGGLDVLCNNAGDDERHDWEKVTGNAWDFYQSQNLKHQFFCSREFAKYVSDDIGGSIICIGSIAYLNGSTGMPSYTAAKAGLVGLVNTMANLLGPRKIRVNLVQPGWVMTEKQIKKWIDADALKQIEHEQLLPEKILPEEPAKLVLFLASDQSKMITKQVVNVDAGWV